MITDVITIHSRVCWSMDQIKKKNIFKMYATFSCLIELTE